MREIGLAEINFKSKLRVVFSVLATRFRILSRYRAWFLMDVMIPIVFAAFPILLGTAVAGGSAQAAANFQVNTAVAGSPGTSDFKLYMLVGANVFIIVSSSLWMIGFWLRRERMTGTLESLYLASASRFHVLAGVSLYVTLRSILSFFLAFGLGCFIFQINPLQGNLWMAIGFLLVGMIPLWGIGFLFGAFVLRVREAGPLMNLLQWVVAFMMGIFFPITMFPPLLRYIALAFPPTWMNNGVRASLLELSYFFGEWYFDWAVLWMFCFIMPLIGLWGFSYVERKIKKNEGVGQF